MREVTQPDIVFLMNPQGSHDTTSRDLRELQRTVAALGVRQDHMSGEVSRIGESVERTHALAAKTALLLDRHIEEQRTSQDLVSTKLANIQAMLAEIMSRVPA